MIPYAKPPRKPQGTLTTEALRIAGLEAQLAAVRKERDEAVALLAIDRTICSIPLREECQWKDGGQPCWEHRNTAFLARIDAKAKP